MEAGACVWLDRFRSTMVGNCARTRIATPPLHHTLFAGALFSALLETMDSDGFEAALTPIFHQLTFTFAT